MPLTNKLLSAIALLLVTSLRVSGQAEIDLEERMVWYYGEVTYTNEKTATGLLNYSLITDVLNLKSDKGQESLSTQQVSRFILTDSIAEKKFYSIPIQDGKQNRRTWVFMESIYENDDLAILLRHETKGSRYTSDPYVKNLNAYNNPSVSEVLYLANKKGSVIRYARKLVSKEGILFGPDNYGLIGQQTVYGANPNNRYKVLDKNALELLMLGKYPEVEDYIKQEKKKLNMLGDLIDVFEFYGSL
ncbi:MAG: hypothetical protein NXI20_01860 [bacterium]|nr:hypothetical protein [bacterium]